MRKFMCRNCEEVIYEEAVIFEHRGNVLFFCCKDCFYEWVVETGIYKDIVSDWVTVERLSNVLDNRPRLNYKSHSRIDI